jgi:iron complex transport system ATP-binding protein
MVSLAAKNLSVSLGGRPVLHGLEFDAHAGTWLGIVGPNGSGKTTLLRALAGLIDYSGSIQLSGRDLAEWSAGERARTLAMVAQSVPLSFDFSVLELVLLGRSPHKGWLAPFDERDRVIAREALDRVDLVGFENRSVLNLSGGEQRRALLAQALAQEARVLLLDEPTSHLDVHHRYEFLDHARSLVENGGTVVGVFHDLELAARYSDRIIVLHDGHIVANGKPREALTGDLIAKVFRMKAEADLSGEEELIIQFLSPIPRS